MERWNDGMLGGQSLRLHTSNLSLITYHFWLAGPGRVCHNAVRQAPLMELRQVGWRPIWAGQMW